MKHVKQIKRQKEKNSLVPGRVANQLMVTRLSLLMLIYLLVVQEMAIVVAVASIFYLTTLVVSNVPLTQACPLPTPLLCPLAFAAVATTCGTSMIGPCSPFCWPF
jgi:hypothetical protein